MYVSWYLYFQHGFSFGLWHTYLYMAHCSFQLLLLETSVSKLEIMKRRDVKCRLNSFRAYKTTMSKEYEFM